MHCWKILYWINKLFLTFVLSKWIALKLNIINRDNPWLYVKKFCSSNFRHVHETMSTIALISGRPHARIHRFHCHANLLSIYFFFTPNQIFVATARDGFKIFTNNSNLYYFTYFKKKIFVIIYSHTIRFRDTGCLNFTYLENFLK